MTDEYKSVALPLSPRITKEIEFDTWCSTFPTCPWCGFEHRDASHEFINNDIYTCEGCDRDFQCMGEMSVTFTTNKVLEQVKLG